MLHIRKDSGRFHVGQLLTIRFGLQGGFIGNITMHDLQSWSIVGPLSEHMDFRKDNEDRCALVVSRRLRKAVLPSLVCQSSRPTSWFLICTKRELDLRRPLTPIYTLIIIIKCTVWR
jgi:hypothetical protein